LGLNIELVPVLTDKPDDTANTGQLADALIEEDVDVIIGSLRPGIEGVFEAAGTVTDRKILITAINAEKTYLGPENYLTALLYDYADPLVQIVTRIRAGETGGYYPLGFNSGIKLQFPLQNVPEEIDAQVKGIIERISAGEITVVEDSSQISSTK
jgi:basic membrane protein A